MRIEDSNAPTHKLRVPGMSEKYRQKGVNIPESGVTRVDRQTGEAIVEHCPTITEVKEEDESE